MYRHSFLDCSIIKCIATFHTISLTASTFHMLALMALTFVVAWADNCKDTCQVTCVFPSMTCKFVKPSIQSACLDDYDYCVAACTRKCECTESCKDRPKKRFETCMDRCCSQALIVTGTEETKIKITDTGTQTKINTTDTGTQTKINTTDTTAPISKTQPVVGILLTGEDGHLE